MALREIENLDHEVKHALKEIEEQITKIENGLTSSNEVSNVYQNIQHTNSRIKTMEIELKTIENRNTARKFKPVIRDHRAKIKEFEQTLQWSVAATNYPVHSAYSNGIISLNKHNISAQINQRYALIVYSFYFENMAECTNGSAELLFEITIDPNAFISTFLANIDGEIFHGKTKEKQEANKQYMIAKTKHENAILILQPYDNIPNVFLIKTNIDAKSKILLQITIEQYLCKKFDFNELNIEILRNFTKYHIQQNFDHIAIQLDIKDSNGIFDVIIPSSTAANVDDGFVMESNTMDRNENHCLIKGKIMTESHMNEFSIKYKVKGEQDDSIVLYDHKSSTFCHIISDIISDSIINEDDIDEGVTDDIKSDILVPRRVVFIIDKSGSMSGNKWDKTQAATISALKQLRINHDRGGIIFFDDAIEKALPTLIPATEDNINEAVDYVRNQSIGGATNIHDALMEGIEYIKQDIKMMNSFYMNQIIFVTDGSPTYGVRDTKQIILNVKNANTLQNDKYYDKISIFTFGIGGDGNDSSWINDLDHSFLKLLALNNNGSYKRIKQSNCQQQLVEDFRILSKPMLSKVNVIYDKNVSNLTNATFDTLYSGNDLIICGKINNGEMEEKRNTVITATISAISGKMVTLDKTKPVHIRKVIRLNIGDIDENDSDNGTLDRLWAYLKLQQFAKDTCAADRNEGPSPLWLAMKYEFVTPWTSMIVVKEKKKATQIPHPYPTPHKVKPQHYYPTPDASSEILNDEDAAINYGRRLHDRAIMDLAETEELAVDIGTMLHEQTEQIALIDNGLVEMDDEVNRASRSMKRIGRRIMTDKYIWCLIILIVLAIIVIIIGTVINGNISKEM